MRNKILTIACLALSVSSAQAGTVSDFFYRAADNAKYAFSCGNNDLYIPIRTWHNRLFYDKEHIDKYNEEPWGIGFGRSIWATNGTAFMSWVLKILTFIWKQLPGMPICTIGASVIPKSGKSASDIRSV